MEEDAARIGRVVPYLLFVSAVFLVGFVFVTMNGPLLLALLEPKQPTSLGELVQSYLRIIERILSSSSAIVVIAGSLACLISGFLFNMLAQSVAFACGMAGRLVMHLPGLRRLFPDARFFTGASYFRRDHPALRLWLLKNPAAKLQWEWELFNFVLYWGLATNIIVTTLIVYMLIGTLLVPLVAFSSFVSAYSILRSRIMLQYQEQCAELMASRLPSDRAQVESTGKMPPVSAGAGDSPNAVPGCTGPTSAGQPP